MFRTRQKSRLKKGDKVKILMPDMTVRRLKNGRRSGVSKTGIVLHVDGAYVWVKPARWGIGNIEFLENEVKKI